jgi:hypothetical protein
LAQRRPDEQGKAPEALSEIQRFRNALVQDQRRKKPTLPSKDAFYLMVLASRARPDGTLRGRREGRDGYYDEALLVAFLRVPVRTFRRHWKKWTTLGWVTSSRPIRRQQPERRLAVPRQATFEFDTGLSAREATPEFESERPSPSSTVASLSRGEPEGDVPGVRERLESSGNVWRQSNVSTVENLVGESNVQVSGDAPEELNEKHEDEPGPETDLSPEQLDEIYDDSLEAAS